MLAGLPYVVWPIGSLFILASRKKEDPFLYYHAVQALLAGAVLVSGLFLLMVGLVASFRVLPGAASYFPVFLSLGFFLAAGGVALSIVLTAIFLGWRATEGEMTRLPLLGDFAEEKMLDQTGMTRRQFEAMLEASMKPEGAEEEIPFPEVRAASPPPTPTPARSTTRLDAARAARGRSRDESVPTAPPAAPLGQRRPSPRPSPAPSQPPRSWSPVPSAQQQQQPVIREVDLIGHYKEKGTDPDRLKKTDVLKQWLSSVDEA